MAFRDDQSMANRKEQWNKMQQALRSQNGWGSKYVDNSVKWDIPPDSTNYGCTTSTNKLYDVWDVEKRKHSSERFANATFDYGHNAEHDRNIAGNFGQYSQKSPPQIPIKRVC